MELAPTAAARVRHPVATWHPPDPPGPWAPALHPDGQTPVCPGTHIPLPHSLHACCTVLTALLALAVARLLLGGCLQLLLHLLLRLGPVKPAWPLVRVHNRVVVAWKLASPAVDAVIDKPLPALVPGPELRAFALVGQQLLRGAPINLQSCRLNLNCCVISAAMIWVSSGAPRTPVRKANATVLHTCLPLGTTTAAPAATVPATASVIRTPTSLNTCFTLSAFMVTCGRRRCRKHSDQFIV